jgi:hypothetical protein
MDMPEPEMPEWMTETEVLHDIAYVHEGKWRLHVWHDITNRDDAVDLLTSLVKEGVTCQLIEKSVTKKVLKI